MTGIGSINSMIVLVAIARLWLVVDLARDGVAFEVFFFKLQGHVTGDGLPVQGSGTRSQQRDVNFCGLLLCTCIFPCEPFLRTPHTRKLHLDTVGSLLQQQVGTAVVYSYTAVELCNLLRVECATTKKPRERCACIFTMSA